MASSEIHWLKTMSPARGPLAMILLAHLLLVVIHFTHLWQTGLYAHFPLVLATVAGLLWYRWEGTRNPGRWQSSIAAMLLGGGFLLLLLSVLSWSSWLGYVAALVTGGAILLRTCPAPIKQWGPAWLLLWLLVPLPMGLDRHVSLELQSYSSRGASLLLDFFRVNHLQTGNAIEVPGMKFSIEEACSGIHSLYVLIAVSAILAVVLRHGWLHAIGLIASSAGWAGAANTMRVASVVIAASWWGIDLSTAWRHELWGLMLFGIAFMLVLSTDRVLLLLFGPAEGEVPFDRVEDQSLEEVAIQPVGANSSSEEWAADEESQESEESSGSGVGGREKRIHGVDAVAKLGVFQSWTVAGMFACLGLAQALPRSTAPPQPARAISLAAFDEETLPVELAGWKRLGFQSEHRGTGNTDGEFSFIWRYQRGSREAVLSLDFPFSGWHQLTHCYRGRGCRVLDWHLEPSTSPKAELAVASLELESTHPATLLFAEWNANGAMLAPPATEGPSWSRLLTDLKHRWGYESDSAGRCVYQLQALSPTPRGRSRIASSSVESDAAALRQLFSESLEVLRKRTAAGGAP